MHLAFKINNPTLLTCAVRTWLESLVRNCLPPLIAAHIVNSQDIKNILVKMYAQASSIRGVFFDTAYHFSQGGVIEFIDSLNKSASNINKNRSSFIHFMNKKK